MGSLNNKHLKALLKKNWIYWKRQYLISIAEIVLPIMLMIILMIARQNIYETTITEKEFYQQAVLDQLDLTQEQLDIIGPLLDEELKFPKVNYMVYPFFYKKGYQAQDLIDYEVKNYQFLSYQARARNQLDPGPCIKRWPVRQYIGLFPKDNYTQYIEQQLGLWSYQYTVESGYFVDFQVLYFNSEEQMMDYVAHPDYEIDDLRPGLCAGMSHYARADGNGHEFRIHLTDQPLDDRQTIAYQLNPAVDKYNTDAYVQDYVNYNKNFYSYFHNWMANMVLRNITGVSDALIINLVMQMKVDGSKIDQFDYVVQYLFPIVIVLLYIIPIHRMVMRIVNEKQTKVREVMRMMGMSDVNYWLSWFIFYFIIVTIIGLSSSLILCTTIFTHSSWYLIFFFIWGLGISLFGYVIFIQSLFTNPRTASLMSILIYFFTYFADYAVNGNETEEDRKIIASILPTIAMSRALTNIASFEKGKIGLSSENVSELYNNYKVSHCYYMYAIGFVLSFLVGIYLTNVLPTTPEGIRKKWYYPFKKSFWCKKKKQPKGVNAILNESSGVYVRRQEDDIAKELDRSVHKSLRMEDKEDEGALKEDNGINERADENHNHSQRSPQNQSSLIEGELELRGLNVDDYEPMDQIFCQSLESQNKLIRIQNLQKTYANGFTAVKGLNMKMYQGQIFALLGHNGAGKTTTIQMLTGLIKSSAGVCEAFGLDLQEDIEEMRLLLGVCPQHDILFDLLTPEEHLDIFSDFKGVSQKDKVEQIKKMINDIGLDEHRDNEARYLSGGNKRKLSVAIALIGGSKFVLLDEPTAGMDITARRKLWNMLKEYKYNRIVLLTTHYMDEADVLGDRIGIMSAGKLTCLGSSLFLKNRYGVGYQLQIIKTSEGDKIEIHDYLREKLGNEVKLLSEISSEVAFQVPYSLSNKFKEFFDQFDRDLERLKIVSYGMSITTLEEVFLKVGSLDPAKQQLENYNREQLDQQKFNDEYSIAEDAIKNPCIIFWKHLAALLRKRTIMYKRSFKSLVIEVFVPIILVALGLGFSKIQFFVTSPSRHFTTSLMPQKQKLVVNSNLIKTTGNDYSPKQIIQSLPNFDKVFDVQYIDYSQINLTTEEGEKPLVRQYDTDVFNYNKNDTDDPIRLGSYFIYQADKTKMQFRTLTEVNLLSQDVAGFYPHYLYQAILRLASGKPDYQFEMTTRPFPVTESLKKKQANVSGIFLVVVVAIAFSLVPAVIISFILHEKEKNIRHLQLISGMSLPAYWMSNMLFDLVKSYIPCGIIVGLIYAFDVTYTNIWVMFLLYPLGIIPFTYVMSFLFTSESVAQTSTIFLHFLIGGLGSILVSILRMIDTTQAAGDALMWVFKLIPTYCLTEPIAYKTMKDRLIKNRPYLDLDDFDFKVIGGDIYFMIGHAVLWTLVLIMIECRVFNCISKFFDRVWSMKIQNRNLNIEEDEDVKQEEFRVAQTAPSNLKIRVDSFRKVYTHLLRKSFLAVQKTSFGLNYGECFALLGVNGAGKTTTFRSLTGEVLPTNGMITINGMDITSHFNKIRKLIGYCPQHDAIFDLMTVREHLYFYAKIKGVKADLIPNMVDQQIRMMNLNDHQYKLAGTLSGGNKRKLSVAICVIGNPPIILLDEPSAGMDPEARRFMWSVVAKISQQRKKSAVILTTHSMEEAEALSTKMGIMIQGGIFRCFGTGQHIKSKFGTGYEIEVKISKQSNLVLQQKVELYGLGGQEFTDFSQLQDLLRRKMHDEFLISELEEGGLGDNLYQESLKMNGQVQSISFITWVFIEVYGAQLIRELCDKFGEVDILEHYNDYYKLRVPKGLHTIGQVFSLIENKKEELSINEYSASQTTLEQIFQKFANQVTEDKHKIVHYRQKGARIHRLKVGQLDEDNLKSAAQQNQQQDKMEFNINDFKPEV